MAWHSVNEASELTGVSVRTIHRKINDGVLSSKIKNRRKEIETSELIRFFGDFTLDNDRAHVQTMPVTGDAVAVMQAKLESAEKMANQYKELWEMSQKMNQQLLENRSKGGFLSSQLRRFGL